MYGFSESDAKNLIAGGFLGQISKRLPIEYALELRKMIEIEIGDDKANK
jgi:Fe-S cluster assembly scaffold protein SufB